MNKLDGQKFSNDDLLQMGIQRSSESPIDLEGIFLFTKLNLDAYYAIYTQTGRLKVTAISVTECEYFLAIRMVVFLLI
jgi:hypothetical protein